MTMRLNELERRLETVKGFSSPSSRLEQYQTPASLAARLLFHAAMNGDIEGKRIGDLGCGTGILSIGAALLGAREVVGIDADENAIALAHENAGRFGVEIRFLTGNAEDPDTLHRMDSCDTVVMNPPFGAQKAHADRPFIDVALQLAPVTYGIFNAGSRQFIESYIAGRGRVKEIIGGALSIRRMFTFHTHQIKEIAVEIMVITRESA
jgi:putative methylase